jgi:hypothetical protein
MATAGQIFAQRSRLYLVYGCMTINPSHRLSNLARSTSCKPYQQVPFQYSCHILTEDGTVTHRDYLHTDAGDPRRPLAEALIKHIGETGSLIAYNTPFERGVLHHLAAHLPEYAERLLDLVDRLWDQLPIFRQH